jgi:hypothetical protein
VMSSNEGMGRAEEHRRGLAAVERGLRSIVELSEGEGELFEGAEGVVALETSHIHRQTALEKEQEQPILTLTLYRNRLRRPLPLQSSSERRTMARRPTHELAA